MIVEMPVKGGLEMGKPVYVDDMGCVTTEHYSGDTPLGIIMTGDGDGGTATVSIWGSPSTTGCDWTRLSANGSLVADGPEPIWTEPSQRGPITCPWCGTENLPNVLECGAGRWNGCGGSLASGME